MPKDQNHLLLSVPLGTFAIFMTGYLLINDRRRRQEIERRSEEFTSLSTLRYGSLKLGGRFWNPFPEWREQGAWEWIVWQLTKKWFNDHGLPQNSNELVRTLPHISPDFDLLFPLNTLNSPASATPPSEMSESWANVSQVASVRSLIDENHDEKERDKEKSMVSFSTNQFQSHNPRPALQQHFTFTWIGQSTSFVQLHGLNILTDPTFAERPVEYIGPKRLRPAPCRLEDFKRIDIVLVSHNHFDHLDGDVVKKLGNNVTWYVPLGMKAWFARKGVYRVVEMDWWQEVRVREAPHVMIACTPAMHWTARTPLDTNRSLWCSFVVKGPRDSFFHCGDTGYCGAFAEIGVKYGPISLALIPIGSYDPEWHLSIQHVGPRDAIKIHKDVQAKRSIGVHWGTWIMSEEKYDEPPMLLSEERRRANIDENEFHVVKFGETLLLRKSDD